MLLPDRVSADHDAGGGAVRRRWEGRDVWFCGKWLDSRPIPLTPPERTARMFHPGLFLDGSFGRLGLFKLIYSIIYSMTLSCRCSPSWQAPSAVGRHQQYPSQLARKLDLAAGSIHGWQRDEKAIDQPLEFALSRRMDLHRMPPFPPPRHLPS